MAAPMSAQLWKRVGDEARVTFRCPWCDVVGVSVVHGRYGQRGASGLRAGCPHGPTARGGSEQRGALWLLAGCPNVPRARGVLIRVPTAEPWTRLDTGDDGMLLAPACVLPRDG